MCIVSANHVRGLPDDSCATINSPICMLDTKSERGGGRHRPSEHEFGDSQRKGYMNLASQATRMVISVAQ